MPTSGCLPSSPVALSSILGADEPPHIAARQALSSLGLSVVGEFRWSSSDSGSLLDFEHVVFDADGTYTARVEATLVNPGVRCSRFPFTLPEEGLWSVFKVASVTKLRVRPSTGRSRVYVVMPSDDGRSLVLSRRGVTTRLFHGAVV